MGWVDGDHESDAESDISFCSTSESEDEVQQTTTNLQREIYYLKKKVNQLLEVLSKCKFKVPENPSEAERLLHTCLDLGGLPTVVDQCSDVLKENLDSENVIKTFKYANQKEISCLAQACRNYILKEFMTVCTQDDFPALSETELFSFLEKDELNVTGEEAVFKAILKWIRRDTANRKLHIGTLIKAVRLYSCDMAFLKVLRDHFYLWDSLEFQSRLTPVIQEMEANEPGLAEKVLASKRKVKLQGD